MNLRIMGAAIALALGTFGTASLALADRYVEFDITTAPPAPPGRVEVVPPSPREGYIYEPGHYGWDGTRYVWIGGEYIQDRPGHHYIPYVLERRGEHWYYRSGHWDDD